MASTQHSHLYFFQLDRSNMSSTTLSSNPEQDERLLTSIEAEAILKTMSDELVTSVANQLTGMYMDDGDTVNEQVASAIARSAIVTASDGCFYLEIQRIR
ncbi:hypothetical protein PM082_009695 [Marasmius tenuissimus]|nr:hypothetical protein PM082_009695 [Marasmius tenuissimus]